MMAYAPNGSTSEQSVGAPRASIRLVHVVTVPLSLRFLSGQLTYLQERGFDVRIISSPGSGLDAFCREESVVACRIEMPRRITPVRDLVALWRMIRYLRAVKPDIVHAQTPKGGLLGTLAAWFARVPVRVYHIRGLPFVTATGLSRLLLRTTERIACAFATQVLCVSQSVRDIIVQEGICSPERAKVLLRGSGNGVDAVGRFNPKFSETARRRTREKLGIPTDAVVAGFVGRIVRDKGGIELVAAWKRLRDEFQDLHILVVGDFEPRDPVPPAVRESLQNDPRVHFTGWVEDTPPLYSAMDLVVLPTHREGFPNVALEAAAMALPIVATHVPGCIDAILDGETGTLVPPGDSDALAAGVREYLNAPALRRAHGLAGRERVLRDYRQDAIWEAVYREYMRLLLHVRCERDLAVTKREIVTPVRSPSFLDSGMRASSERGIHASEERP